MLILFEGEHGPKDTLRFIEEKGSIGVWAWDLKSGRMEWSPGLFRLLGLEPGTVEPSYALLETMVHPDDLRPPGEIERILREAGSIKRRFRIVQSDGRVRWIVNHGEILVGRAGKPGKAIGIVIDITRLHEARSTVEALEERYSELVEAMSAVVATVDADGITGDTPPWREFAAQIQARVITRRLLDGSN